MGPVNGSQKSLLAWRHAPPVSCEEPEPVVEGGCDALGGQAPYPRRRELKGKRNAVQALADLGHRRSVLVGYAEVRIGLGRSRSEQPDGVVAPDSLGRLASGWRQAEGRHAPRHFTIYGKRFAAGGQNGRSRRGPQKAVHER